MVIYIKNIIEMYISKLTKEDIIKFSKKNGLVATDSEIDFVYNFIKQNHQEYLNNPSKFDITIYKNQFSSTNYNFIVNLINKYSKFIK